MLTPLSVIHNLAFIQCVLTILDDHKIDTNIVLFIKEHNRLHVPVITTGKIENVFEFFISIPLKISCFLYPFGFH